MKITNISAGDAGAVIRATVDVEVEGGTTEDVIADLLARLRSMPLGDVKHTPAPAALLANLNAPHALSENQQKELAGLLERGSPGLSYREGFGGTANPWPFWNSEVNDCSAAVNDAPLDLQPGAVVTDVKVTDAKAWTVQITTEDAQPGDKAEPRLSEASQEVLSETLSPPAPAVPTRRRASRTATATPAAPEPPTASPGQSDDGSVSARRRVALAAEAEHEKALGERLPGKRLEDEPPLPPLPSRRRAAIAEAASVAEPAPAEATISDAELTKAASLAAAEILPENTGAGVVKTIMGELGVKLVSEIPADKRRWFLDELAKEVRDSRAEAAEKEG